jgi:hypothetical protein
MPARADIRCSIVLTETLPFAIVVAFSVSTTFPGRASIAGTAGRSVLRKMTPRFAGAGYKVIATFSPVCNPMPSHRTGRSRVRWWLKILSF